MTSIGNARCPAGSRLGMVFGIGLLLGTPGCDLAGAVGLLPGLAVAQGKLMVDLSGKQTGVTFDAGPDQPGLTVSGDVTAVAGSPGHYAASLTGSGPQNNSTVKVGLALELQAAPPTPFTVQTNLGPTVPAAPDQTMAFLGLLWPTQSQTGPVTTTLAFSGTAPQTLALSVNLVSNRVTPHQRPTPDQGDCSQYDDMQRRSCQGAAWTYFYYCSASNTACDCAEMYDVNVSTLPPGCSP